MENEVIVTTLSPEKAKRNASLDLLRVTAMAFIVLLHLVQNNLELNAVKDDAAALRVPTFLPLSGIACIAVIGVNLFFLLSGYFGIKAKPSKVLYLIFKLYVLWTLSTLIGMAIGVLKFSSFFEWFLFVGKAISRYWFIIVYILLCLAAPVLNLFAEALQEKGRCKYFIFISLILFSAAGFVADIFYPYFGTGDGFLPVWAWVVYLYGRLLKSNESGIRLSAGSAFLLWFVFTALNFAAMAVAFAVFGSGRIAIHCFAYNNPLVLLSAVFLFIAFSKVKVNAENRAIKLIAAVAPHTLTVYLMHSNNPLVSPYRAWLINLSPYMWGKYLLLLPNVFALYALGVAVDLVYEYTIGKPIKKLCNLTERGILFLYNRLIERKN